MDPVTREHIRRLELLGRQVHPARPFLRDAIEHMDRQSVEIERLRRRIAELEKQPATLQKDD